MYSRIVCFLMAMFFFQSGQAQLAERPDSTYFQNGGDHHFNLGIGLINRNNFVFDIFGIETAADPTPALNISYEYALLDEISIGIQGSFFRVNAQRDLQIKLTDFENIFEDILADPCYLPCVIGLPALGDCECEVEGTVTERVTVSTIGGKLGYHRKILPKLDTYSTVFLGYSFNRRKTIVEQSLNAIADEIGVESDVPSFVYYANAGLRFYVTEKIGLYGEYGYGNSHLLNIGATYRL